MKEDSIIRKIYGPNPVPTDDCFLWQNNQLITTDSMSEGTHFRHDWSSPEEIAWKLVEINVSDIGASGGIPKICFLNLGLSPLSSEEDWINRFAHALNTRLAFHNIIMAGGDTFFSTHTVLGLTMIGNLSPGFRNWNRSDAKFGDKLYVTGNLGLSSLGYNTLLNETSKENLSKLKELTKISDENEIDFLGNWKSLSIAKHLTPTSRYNVISNLQKFNITSCLDITDGLVQDAQRLADTSSVNLSIQINSLPDFSTLSKLMTIDEMISSGEELELLFTSSDPIPQSINGIRITEIGSVDAHAKLDNSPDILSEPTNLKFYWNAKLYHPQSKGFIHFQENE